MNRRHAHIAGLALGLAGASPLAGQHMGHQMPVADTAGLPVVMPPASRQTGAAHGSAHDMWMVSLGRGFQLMGMGQIFPTVTTASVWREKTLLNTSGIYATQPAVMSNLSSPRGRLVLRTTLNFEAWTQSEGELTYGGWGEGFIDSRHPHTMLHEAVLTANWWNIGGGALSISAGKGFAPYGTDDPMGRPAVKYPTNHHLSQVLERWTANTAYLRNGWSLEAGIFGGAEPESAWDFGNIGSFGDSWSARVAKRFGEGHGPASTWELSASHASVAQAHHGATLTTRLSNAAARHEGSYRSVDVYGLVEASRSEPDNSSGHFSLLAELQLGIGRERRHAPYARTELATRPEYVRAGAPGTPEFFRYDHDSHEIGATRWLSNVVGYGYTPKDGLVGVRPYAELQHNFVMPQRGGIEPRDLYGTRSFWSVSVGARVYLGGGPMRMGSYGALDPMATSAHKLPPRRTATH